MPLIINDVRERMKCNLIKPGDLVPTESLNSQYSSFKLINEKIPIGEQIKAFSPISAILDEKPVRLSLNHTISLEERRLRKLYSHKPDFCGSCKEEQRFDSNKYCHLCQKDPHYNPDDLEIKSEGKTIQDYDLMNYQKYKDFMKN